MDLFAVYLCFTGSMWLRFGALRLEEIVPAIGLPFVAAFIFQYYGLYKVNVFLDRSGSSILLIKSLVPLSIIYVLGAFLTKFVLIDPSRLAFFYFVASLLIVFGIYRVLLLPAAFRRLSSKGFNRRKVLIVGAGKSGRQIAYSLTYRRELGAEVLGFVDDSLPIGASVMSGFHVVGNSASLDTLVKMNLCDELVIAIDNITEQKLLSLIAEAKKTGTTVKVVSNLFRTVCKYTKTESYDLQPTATVTRGLYSPVTAIYQRVTDIVLSVLGLAVLSPFMIAAALGIKLTSPGPVFYLHQRIGKNGKPFEMFKFRSMYFSAQEDEMRKEMMLRFMAGESARKGNGGKHGTAKVIDSSRVTPFGRLLRKTSFDEMPQLFNVIKGDMSLVGPRPVLPYEFEAMKEWHKERNRVLPGCTGFWQVYGRAKTSFDDMVAMDIYMIENMSPWLYLQLFLKTFPVLISGK